jgi:hypothetical protein
MTRMNAAFAASSIALLAGGNACAQTVDSALQAAQTNFSRSGNVSVLERPHPEYDALGVRVGAFTALPTLQVGVEENDNIYATQNDTRSDAIVTLAPEIQLNSNWSRDQLQLFIRSASREYTRYTSETSTDFQLGGSGRLDLGDGQAIGGADYGQFTEPRTSPDTPLEATRPIRYDQTDVYGGYIQEFNRFRLTARGDWQKLDYDNGADAQGNVIFQKDRDHDVATLTGKMEYALTPDAALLINVVYNNHGYDLTPPATEVNRNSQGETVEVGANFDLSHLVRGEVRVGYLRQDFQDPSFREVSGLSAAGKVDWFATQLVTVTLAGSRSLQDAAISESPAYIASVASVEADYELLRNVILTGRFGYETDHYLALDRNDRNINATVSATYMMNRLLGFSLSYAYLDETSTGAAVGPIYADNRFTLSTKLKF